MHECIDQSKEIFFSIVIPTCQRNDDLARCLNLLAPGEQIELGIAGSNQSAPGAELQEGNAKYEVIVADDGFASTAEQLIRESYPWVRWVKSFCKGPASNRNNGVTQALGNWIVFIDDDCLPSRHWLWAYKKAIETGSSSVYEGRTSAADIRRSLDMEAPLNNAGGRLWSCNFAIRAQLFRELGGFDTSFPGAAMEDVELLTRLNKAIENVCFVPEAEVYHPWRSRRGWHHGMLHARSVIYYCDKHPDRYPKYKWNKRAVALARVLLKGLYYALFQFSGRGFVRTAMIEIVYYIQLTWLQWRSHKHKCD